MNATPRQKAKLVPLRQRSPAAPDFNFSNARQLFELVAGSIENADFLACATAFVEALSVQFGCDRACLGTVDKNSLEVCVVSQTAQFDRHSALLRAISDAMEEAKDQEASITFPGNTNNKPLLFTQAHEALSKINGECCICSVPLPHGSRVIGIITLERARSNPFSSHELRVLEITATLMGPLLDLKRLNQQSLGKKIAQAAAAALQSFVGARYYRAKLGLVLVMAAVSFLSSYETAFRITGESRLEGSVERAVIAPIDGYIAETFVRPGDVVGEGQVLARLDDKELVLKKTQWSAELQRLDKEFSSALAKKDRTEVAILSAKKEQILAQSDLVAEELSRLRISAPFEAVVLEGDLSKSLRAPVRRGEVLFTIAPRSGYRIILKILDGDIAYIKPGQSGHLTLSSFPGEALPLVVQTVTPVSTPGDGANYFRVEASLATPDSRLKPGMEGIAKIDIGEANVAWVLTRKLTEWVQLAVWQYMP